jgi:hypothetical protein
MWWDLKGAARFGWVRAVRGRQRMALPHGGFLFFGGGEDSCGVPVGVVGGVVKDPGFGLLTGIGEGGMTFRGVRHHIVRR